jgi:hypothetical protein
MAYEFQCVDVFAFDFHLALKPLVVDNVLQPAVRWLVDPESYRKQYGSKVALETGGFRLRPLSVKTRAYHHFWKYYTAVWDKAQPDPWELQLPFVLEPKNAEIEVVVPAGIQVAIRPTVYLFPFGWSTSLEMSLQGSMTVAQLVNRIGELRSSASQPYKLNNTQMHLAGLFGSLADQVRKDLFSGGGPQDVLSVPRHLLVSLASVKVQPGTTPRPYRPAAGNPQMADYDRAGMQSILLGRTIGLPELAELENGKKFLVTAFQELGFALTYFDQGSLLFLQDQAMHKERRNALRCLASNLRHCTMMIMALINFHQNTGKVAAGSPKIAEMRKNLQAQLQALPRYTNAYCRTWCDHHGPLRKLIQRQ